MGFVKFISGVIVGMLIILIVRNRREAKLKDQMKLKDDIFQIFEKSQDIIYYYKVKPYGQYLYISPSIGLFLGEGTGDLLKKI